MAQEKENLIINTGGNRGGGIVGLLLAAGAALGIGYVGNKIYNGVKDSNDKKKQNDAAGHSDEPDYITAKALASLFDLGWYRLGLNEAEKQQYSSLFAQSKDQKKVHEFYTAITKGRSLDDDVSKWITSSVVLNAQTQQTANADKYSTWKTDKNGNVYSTVNPKDLISIKTGNTYFKFFNYFGTATTPDYKKISQNINNTFGKGGDKVIKFAKALYVGNHVFTQTVYFKDSTGINRSQQKVFAYVYGADGNYWGYIDLFEFQRLSPLSGLAGINKSNLTFC